MHQEAQTMTQKGFKAVPHEAAAYSLVNDKEELEGLAIVHVDALLWTGGAEVEEDTGGMRCL